MHNIETTTKGFSQEALEIALQRLAGADIELLTQQPNQQRLALLYNLVMETERNLHLQQNPQDKANGFYRRGLGTPSGSLSLEVPRDRDGDFRPQVLPPHFLRDSEERGKLLHALCLASYSPTQTKRVLSALGMHYSEEEMEKLRVEFLEEFNSWMARDLPQDLIAIYIDAYHTHLKHQGRVQKAVLYSVIGLNFDAEKDLLGMYHSMGSESKGFWLQVFNDIIKRGVKRVIIVASDNFPGIADAIQTLFPKALHQLCFVHLQRNITRNMARDDAKHFNQALSQIKLERSFEHGKARLLQLLESYKTKYPAYMDFLYQHVDLYLAFLHFPPEIRKYFYTTNAVESLNSGFEKLRIANGGFFQSEQALKINVFIHYKKLRFRWVKGMAYVKGQLYNLRQLFAQFYGELPT